jgi:Domain of unknown function (DUF1874).
MTVYLSNAFSLSMISAPTTIKVLEANTENVKDIIKDGFVSAVGHEATAQVITTKLNIPVQVNRINIKLVPGDVLIVFQLLSRLPEGKILSQDELRQMAAKWYVVTLQ